MLIVRQLMAAMVKSTSLLQVVVVFVQLESLGSEAGTFHHHRCPSCLPHV